MCSFFYVSFSPLHVLSLCVQFMKVVQILGAVVRYFYYFVIILCSNISVRFNVAYLNYFSRVPAPQPPLRDENSVRIVSDQRRVLKITDRNRPALCRLSSQLHNC
jgi:hypothetical protein